MKRSKEMTPEEEERYAALGQHVRELRQQRGWTQEELSEKTPAATPVSASKIRAIERRHQKGGRYRSPTLAGLSQALVGNDSYFADYLQNPPRAEDRDDPDPARMLSASQTAQDQAKTADDQMISALREVVTERLNEMVLPWLKKIEKQVRTRADIAYNIENDVVADTEHPDHGEPGVR